MERNDYLIRKKLYSYLIPSVMVTAALQLGSLVDSIIVGNLMGSYAVSALNIAMPLALFLQLPAMLLGKGGSVTAAVYLGKRDMDSASDVLSLSVLATTFLSLIFSFAELATAPFFAAKLTAAQGGGMYDMVKSVLYVNGIGLWPVCAILAISYFMNVDNSPKLSAALHITANVINLSLDYILVKYTPYGVGASTASTIIGYLISGAIFVPIYARSKNRMLKFKKINIIKKWGLFLESAKNGLPNMAMFALTAVSLTVMNTSTLYILGQDMMTVYSITNDTNFIVQLCLNGIVEVIPTIAGVLYGEKDYYGIRRLLMRISKIIACVFAVLICIFLAAPQLISKLYGFSIPELEPLYLQCLRIFSLSFAFYAVNAVIQNYYRTIGQAGLATLDTLLEMFVIKIPLALGAMLLFGVIGIFASMIVSEIAAILIVTVIRIALQKKGKMPQRGFAAIPDTGGDVFYDVTVTGTADEAVGISEKLIDYCLSRGIDKNKANAVGIAAEELTVNIGKYGYKNIKRSYIDICLVKSDDLLILRLRDDGIPFDPLEYKHDETDKYHLGGIELIKRMADKMEYTRVLNMNNTIVEISL